VHEFFSRSSQKNRSPKLIYSSGKFTENQLYSVSACAGSLFNDRIIHGLLTYPQTNSDKDSLEAADLNRDILQAVRLRLSKADYISCPGCGRTHFQIMDVTRRIKEKTSHMIGVKIAIMGCIVNGPGEMADADFGYVGAGQGKITLYKGHTPVKKNIPEDTAVEELLSLIEQSG
jgi:(E)-4-hydroxy-3-methylbut-2-enyl-diphosphate synthase